MCVRVFSSQEITTTSLHSATHSRVLLVATRRCRRSSLNAWFFPLLPLGWREVVRVGSTVVVERWVYERVWFMWGELWGGENDVYSLVCRVGGMLVQGSLSRSPLAPQLAAISLLFFCFCVSPTFTDLLATCILSIVTRQLLLCCHLAREHSCTPFVLWCCHRLCYGADVRVSLLVLQIRCHQFSN